jgi:plastocyanin
MIRRFNLTFISFGISRTAWLASPVLAALLLVAAAPQSAVAAASEVTVKIANFTFSPADLTITPGTTVTWVNNDDIPHALVETEKTFRSKALDTDDRFSFTFTAPGEFSYFCSLHPHMTGKITVKQ